MENKYLEFGKFVNIHGIKGALKAECWCDSPEIATSLKRIYLKEKDGSFTEKKVKRSSPAARFTLMYLDGIETPESARAFKGQTFFADREDIPLEDGAFFLVDIIGLPVFDADTGRKYGTIKEADFDRHTPLYVIQTENKEVLFPAIDEFVKEINIKTGVKICPIEGFFDEI